MRAALVAAVSLCVAMPAVGLDWSSPEAVTRIFREACIEGIAKPAGVIDWALANGFDPVDSAGGSADDLLGGEAGSVLAAPMTRSASQDAAVAPPRVLLAGSAGRCTVWVQGVTGPPLRAAVAQMLAGLVAKGAKLQLQIDRPIERAGAWRSQQQWRYRAVNATQDLGLGAVTTLTDALGSQAFNAAALPPTAAFAPDGVPVR